MIVLLLYGDNRRELYSYRRKKIYHENSSKVYTLTSLCVSHQIDSKYANYFLPRETYLMSVVNTLPVYTNITVKKKK